MADASRDDFVPISILLVDDEPELRKVFSKLLSLAGHDVEAVGTAEQAAWRLAERPFDLILLDLTLPDMNGLEFLQHLRRSGGTNAVVLITASPTSEMAAEARALGILGVVGKPFTFEELRAQVDRVARRLRRAAREELARAGVLAAKGDRASTGAPT